MGWTMDCSFPAALHCQRRRVGECGTVMASATGAYVSILNSEIEKLIGFECEYVTQERRQLSGFWAAILARSPLRSRSTTSRSPLRSRSADLRPAPRRLPLRFAHMLCVYETTGWPVLQKSTDNNLLDSWILYFPSNPPATKLTGFASISGMACGKSGVDMSTPWRRPCL